MIVDESHVRSIVGGLVHVLQLLQLLLVDRFFQFGKEFEDLLPVLEVHERRRHIVCGAQVLQPAPVCLWTQ